MFNQLKCPCGFCYVGKTKRDLRIRISEHRSGIRSRDKKFPAARRFNSPGRGVCRLRFMGVEAVRPLWRGGDRQREPVQTEASWIQHLHTEYPRGLNEPLIFVLFFYEYRWVLMHM